MPASNVDYTAVSHIIHFALVPMPDGTLSTAMNDLRPSYSTDLVARAHAATRKVLVCVGGVDSQVGFQGATSSAHCGTFITNLVSFVSAYGYDGIDIDWEPLDTGDSTLFTNFVTRLRTALTAHNPQLLLTAAAAWQPDFFAAVQSKFDQINLMTYDLSGPWPGWITWFNSPVFDGGTRFQSTGELVPSIDGMVNDFLAAGIASTKLGIGIPFYAVVWSGGTGTSTGGASLPRQTWAAAPALDWLTYDEVMTQYNQPQYYHWDTNA